MIIRLSSLALRLLLVSPIASVLSLTDIPADTPVSQLIKDASVQLAAGNAHEALAYFDIAISRDPRNYLTFFKRGTAYLSLGKTAQAHHDFDKVLQLKPGFESALRQRAKIRARKADWAAARKDYEAVGETEKIAELEEAQGAAVLASEAAASSNWETCIAHAGTAIVVAGAAYDIRKLRATCRFEKGEVVEGISDLQHLIQINTGDIMPYLQSAAMAFYSMGETEKGLKYVASCLQSDPDSKLCMKLRRRQKNIEKDVKRVRAFFEKRQFATGSKLLIDRGGEESGLLKDVKEDFQSYVADGYIYASSPQGLYEELVEMTCQAYVEMGNLKKGTPYCVEALRFNPDSLYGALHKAHQQLESDEFEDCIRTLSHAMEHHQSQKLDELHRKAETLLRRSRTKDYYKVLGLTRDAEGREIKRAYNKLSKIYHPDKASAQGFTPEEAQKKMAQVNEAYEVLSDPELKERFDRGDDPNSAEQQGHPSHGSPFGGQQFMFRHGEGGGFGGFPGGGSFQFQAGGFPGGFGF